MQNLLRLLLEQATIPSATTPLPPLRAPHRCGTYPSTCGRHFRGWKGALDEPGSARAQLDHLTEIATDKAPRPRTARRAQHASSAIALAHVTAGGGGAGSGRAARRLAATTMALMKHTNTKLQIAAAAPS